MNSFSSRWNRQENIFVTQLSGSRHALSFCSVECFSKLSKHIPKKNTGKLSCRIRKLRWRKQKKKFVCCFLSNYPCQFAKLYHRKLFQLRNEHKSISQRSNWKQCNWRRKNIRLNCKNCASHRWHNRKKKHHRRNRKKPGWVRACTSEPSSWYSYNWIFGFSSCARENFVFSERRFVIRLWAGVLSSPKNLHRL